MNIGAYSGQIPIYDWELEVVGLVIFAVVVWLLMRK
jgi:hypothetical protein